MSVKMKFVFVVAALSIFVGATCKAAFGRSISELVNKLEQKDESHEKMRKEQGTNRKNLCNNYLKYIVSNTYGPATNKYNLALFLYSQEGCPEKALIEVFNKVND